MKKLFLILFFFSLLCLCDEQQPLAFQGTIQIQNGETFDKVDRIVKIYDGDTFYITINSYPTIFGTRLGVRINGIDTPEMKDERPDIHILALKAKEYLTNKITSAKLIQLKNIKRDKYFRILADLYIDGVNINREMIEQGLAKEYHGLKKEW